jgi:hypothetical protein
MELVDTALGLCVPVVWALESAANPVSNRTSPARQKSLRQSIRRVIFIIRTGIMLQRQSDALMSG